MPSFRFFLSLFAGLGLWSVMVWCLVWSQGCGGDQSVAPTGYSIRGQVVGQTSYLSEVAIYLSGSVQDTAWTDTEGRFAFVDLPEGRYRLVPFKDEHLFFPPEQAVVLSGEDAVGVEFVEVFAVLVVSVDQLEVDGTPQRRVVELTNDGLGRLSWQVRHSAGWLSVEGSGFDGAVEERADGSLTGQGAGVLTIETSGVGLAAGAYVDTVYVQSNGGAVAIPVSMHVAEAHVPSTGGEVSPDIAELPSDPPSSEPDGDEDPFPVGVNNGNGIFRIAFMSAFEGRYDLWVMDGDGGNPVNLTDDPETDFEPTWSPDGQSIAFSRTLSFNTTNIDWDLWVSDADGSNLVPLIQGPSQDRHPSWSPDGRRIAYDSGSEGIRDIWVSDADGSNPVNLTPDFNIYFDPSWSPDGQHIAYASAQNSAGSTLDIWVMDANGDNPINLTASTHNARDPAWSPDGQRIAYTCVLGEDDYQICLMNADGTEQVPLTDGALIARNPVWTPDGSRILFTALVSKFPSPRHIFSISIDGSDVINLTEEINPDGQYTSPAVSLSP